MLARRRFCNLTIARATALHGATAISQSSQLSVLTRPACAIRFSLKYCPGRAICCFTPIRQHCVGDTSLHGWVAASIVVALASIAEAFEVGGLFATPVYIGTSTLRRRLPQWLENTAMANIHLKASKRGSCPLTRIKFFRIPNPRSG